MTVAGFYRKRQYQPEVIPLDALHWDDDDTGEAQAIPASHPDYDPVRNVEGREEWHRVTQAMKRLTDEQQQVITYRLILGYDVATVAQIIGKKPNAVKALQFRALQSLERLLATPAPIPQSSRSHLRRQEGGL